MMAKDCVSDANWEFQKKELAKHGIFTEAQIEEEYQKSFDISSFVAPVSGLLAGRNKEKTA